MINGRIFIDCFSSLDDVPYKKRSDALVVLRALGVAGRFSCFEVDGRLAKALCEIERQRWAEFDVTSVEYPWTKVALTEVGRAAISGAPR